MLKVLVVTDIHNDFDAARSAYHQVSPDLVLDGGDHSELANIFESTPHFHISGNHEPLYSFLEPGSFPLPNKINAGQYIFFAKGEDKIRFSGIDGNYSGRKQWGSVGGRELWGLRRFKPGELDVLMTHESPLGLDDKIMRESIAPRILEEIYRIKPKYVFSGHVGRPEIQEREGITFVTLDSMSKGYGILSIDGANFSFSPVKSIFR